MQDKQEVLERFCEALAGLLEAGERPINARLDRLDIN